MILSVYMIEAYLASQMKKARYKTIDNPEPFYAEIKTARGVWATGKTLEECRENLLSVLEDWFIFRLRRNLPIPHFKLRPIKDFKKVHA